MKPRNPKDDKSREDAASELFKGDRTKADEFARQADQFVETLGNHEGHDYSGKDLSDHDFSDENCKNTNFAGATLRGADFSGATLIGANLCGAHLGGANLTGATLTGIKIDNDSKFNGTKFFEGLDADGIVKALGVLEMQLKLASGPKGKLHEGKLNESLLEKLKRPILQSLFIRLKEIGYDSAEKLDAQEQILKVAEKCKIFTQPTSKKGGSFGASIKTIFKGESKALGEIQDKLKELDGIRKGHIHKFDL